jgi:hypothetical protein
MISQHKKRRHSTGALVGGPAHNLNIVFTPVLIGWAGPGTVPNHQSTIATASQFPGALWMISGDAKW